MIRLRSRALLGAAAIAAVGLACVALAATSGGTAAVPKGETVAKGSNCFSCHAIDQKVVGPSFEAVATKFAGTPGAAATLEEAVKNGHVGTWGNVAMPPHPELGTAETKEIISWILSLKSHKASAAAGGKSYRYTLNGKTVTTHFPIFKPGTQEVTADVFRGYELYNSYCFRCHGEDALGSLYAPDLRQALNQGMTRQQFLTTAMEGDKAKGMPAWAGFFTPHQIQAIYAYVKARAIGAVPEGEPKQ